jgi:hypothetical protein
MVARGHVPAALVHSRRLAAPGREWPTSGPDTIQRRHPVTAGAPDKTARARGTVWHASGTRARTAQARPRTGIPDASLRGSSPGGRMAATGPPAGLASRWPRRDARLRTSGAARRSPERRHRAAAARGVPLRRTGSLVIAWLARARGSWWPAVGGVAGGQVPAPLTAGQAPPVAGHPREPLKPHRWCGDQSPRGPGSCGKARRHGLHADHTFTVTRTPHAPAGLWNQH